MTATVTALVTALVAALVVAGPAEAARFQIFTFTLDIGGTTYALTANDDNPDTYDIEVDHQRGTVYLAPVSAGRSGTGDEQHWIASGNATVGYQLKNQGTGLCLTAFPPGIARYEAHTYVCNGDVIQRWFVTRHGRVVTVENKGTHGTVPDILDAAIDPPAGSPRVPGGAQFNLLVQTATT